MINTYKEISRNTEEIRKINLKIVETNPHTFDHTIEDIVGISLYTLKAIGYIELPFQSKRFNITSKGQNIIQTYSESLAPAKSIFRKGDVSFD